MRLDQKPLEAATDAELLAMGRSEQIPVEVYMAEVERRGLDVTAPRVSVDQKALSPCPHCGAKAWLRDNQACGWRVECDDCQLGQLDYTDRDADIAAWNRRALPVAGEVAGLVDTLRETAAGCDHMNEHGLRDMCIEAATTLTRQSADIARLAKERDELAQRCHVIDEALTNAIQLREASEAALTEHKAETARVLEAANELEAAGHTVLCGLNARIDAAPSTATPVFSGIADLHDALGHFRAARALHSKVKS